MTTTKERLKRIAQAIENERMSSVTIANQVEEAWKQGVHDAIRQVRWRQSAVSKKLKPLYDELVTVMAAMAVRGEYELFSQLDSEIKRFIVDGKEVGYCPPMDGEISYEPAEVIETIPHGTEVIAVDEEGKEHPATVLQTYLTHKGIWYQVAVKMGPVINLPEKNVKVKDG